MLNLLKAFSIEQILIFCVLLALAIKGVLEFYDWVKARYKKDFNKKIDEIEKDKQLEEDYNIIKDKCDEQEAKLTEFIFYVTKNLEIISKAMMHDIKHWIIAQHEFYMEQGWIDIDDLNMIEYRFSDYTNLGGNSTIPTLMKELRELPKHKV